MTTTDNPSVSVIIPTFNVAKFILAAIESVIEQSYQDFEVIVLDDGSDDDTADIAEGSTDPRVRVFRREHRGPTVSMNDALEQSQGKWVAFLDGDDTWAPGKLKRHIEVMTARPELDMTFSYSRFMDEDGRLLPIKSPPWSGPLTYRDLLISNPAGNGSSVVADRKAIINAGSFDTNFEANYDQELWLRLTLLRSDNIACIPQVLNYYRRRRGQITKDWSIMEKGWQDLFEKHRQIQPEIVNSVEFQSRSNLYRYLSAIAYENKDYRAGCRLLYKSFRSSPFQFLRTYRSYLVAGALFTKTILRSFSSSR